MKSHKNICYVTLLAVFILIAAVGIRADESTTYVSPKRGKDNEKCTQSSPCKTIVKAMGVTEVRGTIVLLDAGETADGKCSIIYDRVVNISKSVTISASSELIELKKKPCFIPYTNDHKDDRSIKVDGDKIVVTLRWLKFAEAGGNVGIVFSGGAKLRVDNCDFSGLNHGIVSTAAGELIVEKSTFNVSFAIWITDNAMPTSATISSSKFLGHTNLPHFPLSFGTNSTVLLEDSQVTASCPISIVVNGAATLKNVQINGSETALVVQNDGSVKLTDVKITSGSESAIKINGKGSAVLKNISIEKLSDLKK